MLEIVKSIITSILKLFFISFLSLSFYNLSYAEMNDKTIENKEKTIYFYIDHFREIFELQEDGKKEKYVFLKNLINDDFLDADVRHFIYHPTDDFIKKIKNSYEKDIINYLNSSFSEKNLVVKQSRYFRFQDAYLKNVLSKFKQLPNNNIVVINNKICKHFGLAKDDIVVYFYKNFHNDDEFDIFSVFLKDSKTEISLERKAKIKELLTKKQIEKIKLEAKQAHLDCLEMTNDFIDKQNTELQLKHLAPHRR